MRVAPALSSLRPAWRTASAPSASRPRNQPWPPVMAMARPAAMTLGPRSTPSPTARATSIERPSVAPPSPTAGTPPRRRGGAGWYRQRVARAGAGVGEGVEAGAEGGGAVVGPAQHREGAGLALDPLVGLG